MGEVIDKAKGRANEVIGKARRAGGDATDRPDIRTQGEAQNTKGGLQKAKGAVKGAINDL